MCSCIPKKSKRIISLSSFPVLWPKQSISYEFSYSLKFWTCNSKKRWGLLTGLNVWWLCSLVCSFFPFACLSHSTLTFCSRFSLSLPLLLKSYCNLVLQNHSEFFSFSNLLFDVWRFFHFNSKYCSEREITGGESNIEEVKEEMSARITYSLSEENQSIHKQIGCMNAIFQIFDRRYFLGSRSLAGRNSKKLLPPPGICYFFYYNSVSTTERRYLL